MVLSPIHSGTSSSDLYNGPMQMYQELVQKHQARGVCLFDEKDQHYLSNFMKRFLEIFQLLPKSRKKEIAATPLYRHDFKANKKAINFFTSSDSKPKIPPACPVHYAMLAGSKKVLEAIEPYLKLTDWVQSGIPLLQCIDKGKSKHPNGNHFVCNQKLDEKMQLHWADQKQNFQDLRKTASEH